jgi:rhodanese-related sulfurtransferase
MWEAAFLRYSLFPWRSTAFELRPAAHVEGEIHSSGDGGPARRSGVFHLRCDPQYSRARHARPESGTSSSSQLDIRNPRDWAIKHIDGSVNIPLNHLQERIREIPRDRRIAVHCAGGYRSSIAASILQQYGLTHLIEMAGGLAAWEAAQLPVVSQG